MYLVLFSHIFHRFEIFQEAAVWQHFYFFNTRNFFFLISLLKETLSTNDFREMCIEGFGVRQIVLIRTKSLLITQ